MEYDSWFTEATEISQPYEWQRKLAIDSECSNRLIQIPTGNGKTLGVATAWVWNRVICKNPSWPRRLIWCLPTRVLVEQTYSEIEKMLQRLGILWDHRDGNGHDGKVGLHYLMGGADSGDWHLFPEADAVLIGTQDMLLSRALNRGYGSGRAKWPMDFGAVNYDVLWCVDEVQLMDVGLATTIQLQVFRDDDGKVCKFERPCHTWWMSATLQKNWLKVSPDTDSLLQLPITRRNDDSNASIKRLEVVRIVQNRTAENEIAAMIARKHVESGNGSNGPTLVIVNTVERAVKVWKKVSKDKNLKSTDVRLIHSRFRPADRANWVESFLSRPHCKPGTDRIIISTQVVEAGVDFSAGLLITDLAPWPSLVQRFGRCARWGGSGLVFVIDQGFEKPAQAKPYEIDALIQARKACERLFDVSVNELSRFESMLELNEPKFYSTLYPYQPLHVLSKHELLDLFDTSLDLSGADIDVSRFIRAGDERDVSVFWRNEDESWDDSESVKPPSSIKYHRNEICAVPFVKARKWILNNVKKGKKAWIWDWVDRRWRIPKSGSEILPGQTLLILGSSGGYTPDAGWGSTYTKKVPEILQTNLNTIELKEITQWKYNKETCKEEPHTRFKRIFETSADLAEDDESLSFTVHSWQTIATHGWYVADVAESIARTVGTRYKSLLHLASRWHDIGKAHQAFQNSIWSDDRPNRCDLAKAPSRAWPSYTTDLYRIDKHNRRPGFRHELASTLSLFDVLQRFKPNHPALLGGLQKWLEAIEMDLNLSPTRKSSDKNTDSTEPTQIEREIIDLSSFEFDLLAYLVCSHHGKVRVSMNSGPKDQQAPGEKLYIKGVMNDIKDTAKSDSLPVISIANSDGSYSELPSSDLDLSPASLGLSTSTGKSWIERVLGLLDELGPFQLAWLESILRSADIRASRENKKDPLLIQ